MSGYNLPDDVSENDPRAPWSEREHYDACPAHEDQPQICKCGVQADGHALIPVPDCDGLEVVEPECGCSEIEKNEAAGRADAKNDAARDRE